MLYFAVALFAAGLLSAEFGFGDASVLMVGAAQVLFVLFAVSAIGFYFLGLRRGDEPVADR